MTTILAALTPVPGPSPQRTAGGTTRGLIAIEDTHRTYREAIGEILQCTRLHFDVAVVDLHELDIQMLCVDPRVVVHAGPGAKVPYDVPCWVELSIDPGNPTEVRVGNDYWEVVNPSNTYLVSVMDRVD